MHSANQKFEDSVICNKDEQFAIDCMAEKFEALSKSKLKTAMKLGAVWLERGGKVSRLRKHKRILRKGDKLHLYYNSLILESTPVAAKLVADLDEYSVWNKPSGMFSQGTKWGDHNSICRWVELNAFADRQSFLVHRLDKATSGLIVVAHSKSACRALTQLFEKREVVKCYRAIVVGRLEESVKEFNSPIDNKSAITKVLENQFDDARNETHLLIKIETGRKHQIRKHLSSIGHPIVGDRLYGNANNENSEDLQLTSCLIKFNCPISGELKSFELS